MGMQTTSRQNVANGLAARRPFSVASMRATLGGYLGDDHQLPREEAGQYRAALAAGRVLYTVYSYRTPIAWVLDDGTVTAPVVFYSATTAQHQTLVRENLSGAA